MVEYSEREMELLKKVCNTLANGMSKKPRHLLDRLDHNELAEKSALVDAAKVWQGKGKAQVVQNDSVTDKTDAPAVGFENKNQQKTFLNIYNASKNQKTITKEKLNKHHQQTRVLRKKITHGKRRQEKCE